MTTSISRTSAADDDKSYSSNNDVTKPPSDAIADDISSSSLSSTTNPVENKNPNSYTNSATAAVHNYSFVRSTVYKEISRQVIRRKLARQRHCLIEKAISPEYLDSLFPSLLQLFAPQTVFYNGGIAKIPEWKISCYLEVMPGGIPTAEPNVALFHLFEPLLTACNDLFAHWYRQQHACNDNNTTESNYNTNLSCRRLMTFITRYTPQPGEQALLKHVDGAGKVDGSIVVALPVDRWSGPESEHAFQGGGLTLWDGGQETHYDTRSGDIALIDRAVWHQADPITKGTRWALVIFYKVE